MLCIGRDEGESVIIGEAGQVLTEPIVIQMLPRTGRYKYPRLGITAQRDVVISRRELLDKPPALSVRDKRECD